MKEQTTCRGCGAHTLPCGDNTVTLACVGSQGDSLEVDLAAAKIKLAEMECKYESQRLVAEYQHDVLQNLGLLNNDILLVTKGEKTLYDDNGWREAIDIERGWYDLPDKFYVVIFSRSDIDQTYKLNDLVKRQGV